MHILLITPAPPGSRSGNRATAARWAKLLRQLGHRVQIEVDYYEQNTDLLIALHAWRSAESIQRYRDLYPHKPLILAITGTDAYRFMLSHPQETIRSMQLADQLVGLHDLIAEALPEDQRSKMNVIYQSAQTVGARNPYKRYFHVSVLGHLREEKDPLRPAMAAAVLPEKSRIQIHQYGKAHSEDWAQLAEQEMAANSRYSWHREVPHYQIRQIYKRSNLLVLPSRMEGGANVISEAVVAGVPVIASKIAGSVGLLGKDYAGYFPLEDTQALAEIMYRAETDKAFYQHLQQQGAALRPQFSEQQERAGWRKLLKQFA